MRGENNSRRKKELVPSHAVISSPSICHTRRSGNPVGWSDILSSGWLCFPQVHPLQTSHTGTQHLMTASGPFTFFLSLWVSENWTSRMQTRPDNTAMEKKKKPQKRNKRKYNEYYKENTHKLRQQTGCVLCECWGLISVGLSMRILFFFFKFEKNE